MNSRCSDCGGTDIVEDYKDGSMVCRRCGLVVIPFLVDDRPQHDSNRDIHYSSGYSDTPRDEQVAATLAMLDIDHPDIECTVTKLVAELRSRIAVKGKLDTLKAYAIYETCRRRKISRVTKEQICACFCIDPKYLLQFISRNDDGTQRYVNTSVQTINERLIKIATLLISDARVRMKVVRHASEIEAKLKNNKDYLNKKPSKMDVVILYYVCNDQNVRIKKTELIKEAGVSNVTFNKHLKLLISLMQKV